MQNIFLRTSVFICCLRANSNNFSLNFNGHLSLFEVIVLLLITSDFGPSSLPVHAEPTIHQRPLVSTKRHGKQNINFILFLNNFYPPPPLAEIYQKHLCSTEFKAFSSR